MKRAIRYGVLALVLMVGIGCKPRQSGSTTATSISKPNFGELEKPGIEGAGKCWKQDVIKVVFNPKLDLALEPSGANTEAGRTIALINVIRAWNDIFKGLQTRQRLDFVMVPDVAGPYAAMQINPPPRCTDAIAPGKTVHEFNFVGVPGMIQGSTGGDPTAPFNGQQPANVAGYIFKAPDNNDPPSSSDASTDVLGISRTIEGPNGISEASFAYLTHYAPTGVGTCDRIPWEYDPLRMAKGAPAYDFYSVMLHEIGHNLGLDHHDGGNCVDPQTGLNNVMRSQIFQGERFIIGSCEIEALSRLYGVQPDGTKGPCHLPERDGDDA